MFDWFELSKDDSFDGLGFLVNAIAIEPSFAMEGAIVRTNGCVTECRIGLLQS